MRLLQQISGIVPLTSPAQKPGQPSEAVFLDHHDHSIPVDAAYRLRQDRPFRNFTA